MDGEAGGEGEGLAASPGAGDTGSSGAAETAEKEAWAGQCGRPGSLTRRLLWRGQGRAPSSQMGDLRRGREEGAAGLAAVLRSLKCNFSSCKMGEIVTL